MEPMRKVEMHQLNVLGLNWLSLVSWCFALLYRRQQLDTIVRSSPQTTQPSWFVCGPILWWTWCCGCGQQRRASPSQQQTTWINQRERVSVQLMVLWFYVVKRSLIALSKSYLQLHAIYDLMKHTRYQTYAMVLLNIVKLDNYSLMDLL